MNRMIAMLGIALVMGASEVRAEFLLFNSDVPAQNAATRTSWLAAIGIATPQFLVNFETGFTNNQNISGVTGLFPGGLVISDTSVSHSALIKSGPGVINDSNPVGVFSVTQNESPFLELDFSANPVDYVGLLDIDQSGTAVILTFVGGATANFTLDSTSGSGDSAEFLGIFRNDRPKITRVQFDASGDGLWGIDNIEYSGNTVVPEPASIALMIAGGLGFLGAARFTRRQSGR